MGQGDDGGLAVEDEAAQRRFRPFGDHLDVGEPFIGGEDLPGVDDDDVKTGDFRQRRQRLGDMNGADDHQAPGLGDGFDEIELGAVLNQAAFLFHDRLPGAFQDRFGHRQRSLRLTLGDQGRGAVGKPGDDGRRLAFPEPLAGGFVGRRHIVETPDQDADFAAAGEAHLPRHFVGDAVIEHRCIGALQYLQRLVDHGPLDAAPGNRADHGAVVADAQMAADGPGRRPPGRDHGGQRRPAPRFQPIEALSEDIAVGHGGLIGAHRL